MKHTISLLAVIALTACVMPPHVEPPECERTPVLGKAGNVLYYTGGCIVHDGSSGTAPAPSQPQQPETKPKKVKDDHGHGNDAGKVDPSNPGKGPKNGGGA